MSELPHLPSTWPREWGARAALADDGHELTYSDLERWTDGASEQLAEHGVGPGDVVALMLSNRVELVVSMFAAWRLGAAATPVNPVFTEHEADFQIRDSGARVVVTDGPQTPHAGLPMIEADALRREPVTSRIRRESDPDDVALIVYTSGSTGRPKGVLLDHGNLAAMTSMMGEHVGVGPQDHCLLVLPLFHVNAICVSVLTPLSVGGRVTILQRFHPVDFLTALATVRPTFFSAVPTIYAHLVPVLEAGLEAGQEASTSSLRFVICGAAPASHELLEAAERLLGVPVVEGYGLTEGTCASTCNPVDGERRAGTVGPALPGQVVEVVDEDDRLVPPGERGEVVISGANVTRGYLNRPEATAETLRGGRLHTGDVGVLDDDGYLSIVDRIKDMIIRGGENIYPQEIESALYSHPDVLEAAVVGAPHDVYGEVPVAYVAAVAGASPDVEELLDVCRSRLTRVKVPVQLHLLGSIPKNPVGKIDKPALRTLSTTAA